MQENVSDEAREDQWGLRSTEKVQHNKRAISIFKEDRVGGRARVTIDEERVL